MTYPTTAMNILPLPQNQPLGILYSNGKDRGNRLWCRIKTFLNASLAVGWHSTEENGVAPRSQKQQPSDPARRRADRLAETLRGSAELTNDELIAAEMRSPTPFQRVVDLRIPLWGIITAVASVVGLLINMWLNVQQLSASMKDVQQTLSAGNVSGRASDVEQATMRIRQEVMDRTLRDLQAQVQANQQAMQQSGILNTPNGGRR